MSAILDAEQLYEVLDARTVDILERRRGTGTLQRRGWLIRRALLIADVAGLSLAFFAAQGLYASGVHRVGDLSRADEFVTFALSLPAWILGAKFYGLYEKDEERTDHSTTDDFSRMFHLVTVCTFALYGTSHLTAWFHPPFSKLLIFWSLAIAGTTSFRAMARAYCRRQINYLQNTIIVGAGEVGQTVARKLFRHPEYGLNLVGFVDTTPIERSTDLRHVSLLGAVDDLPRLVSLLDVERVIYAFSAEGHQDSLHMIRTLNELKVQVDIIPRFFEILGPGADVHSIEGLPLWGLPAPNLSRSSQAVKRALDLLLAAIALAILSPLFVAIAVAIRIDSRGPIIFRQVRVGSTHSKFLIWKFRTMSDDAEERKHEFAHLNKHLMPGRDPRMFKIDLDPRVTRVGAVLRRWSLDELPQLVNVIVGHMSMVGPRPLIPDEDHYVHDWASRRLDLKPGITGLWQVLGRDDIGFDEMVKLDYVYVTTWSVTKDVALLVRTLPTVFAGGGR